LIVIVSPALALFGVIDASVATPSTVALDDPKTVGSSTLVAVMFTLFGLGCTAGAVYCPPVIVPTVLFPPLMVFTDQFTLALNGPVPTTCAVNNWPLPVRISAVGGVTATELIWGGGGGVIKLEPPPPHPASAENDAIKKSERTFAAALNVLFFTRVESLRC
jgi:hypothetical protein